MIKRQEAILHRIFTLRPLGLFLFTVFCLVISFKANAQEISAKASSPKLEYLVGDKISILLVVKMPDGFSAEWLKHEPEPNELETLDSAARDSSTEGRFKTLKIHVTVAGYDSGEATYPAQEFAFRKRGDNKPFVIKSQPLKFHIKTITVDVNKDIKPIVDPVNPGWDLLKIAQWVLLYLLFAGLVLVVYLLWRNSKLGKKALAEPVPYIKQPPWETATEKLAELEQQNLPASGQVKAHYISLSNIVRKYISDIFRIDAMELTTDELIENLQPKSVSRETVDHIGDLLGLADSVKFAKHQPDETENEKAMEEAREIVRRLRGEVN